MTRKSRKIFCFGVGCQKGGTTWLHRYLNDHPAIELGQHKEHHLFDNLFCEPTGRPRARTQARLDKLLEQEAQNSSSPVWRRAVDWQRVRLSFFDDPRAYAAYFRELAVNFEATGDITPAYALLRAEHFGFAKGLLASHGFDVRPVFLMRDPVRRAFSALRMNQRNGAAEHLAQSGDPGRDFERHLTAPRIGLKSLYHTTLEALDAVFQPDEIGCFFYEELFSADPDVAETARAAIVSHLGLQPGHDSDPGEVNTAGSRLALPVETELAARAHFAPVYEYCRSRFGAERIDRIWPAPEGG